jgi:hypothetical protein
MSGVRGVGGFGACQKVCGVRIRKDPGCLTGESEERETWTAESLRTASSNGEGLGFVRKRNGHEETSAVLRFRSTLWLRKKSEWDLVKRCDQPRSISLQLESLILAQSERWRQA